MTERLQRLEDWILKHLEDVPYRCGIYDSRNIAGDPMSTIYAEDGIQVDACYSYDYIEVFGLNKDEWNDFVSFMNSFPADLDDIDEDEFDDDAI